MLSYLASMDWDSTLNGYISYLTLEKGLSANSIEAYERDVRRMAVFMSREMKINSPNDDMKPFKLAIENKTFDPANIAAYIENK